VQRTKRQTIGKGGFDEVPLKVAQWLQVRAMPADGPVSVDEES
jgi:hypothetical protein